MPEKKYKSPDIIYEIIKRDNAIIITNDFTDLRLSILIEYTCICGINHSKKFSQLLLTGAFCKKCSIKNGVNKLKKLMMEKYGVENVSQAKEIKEKKKETFNKNHDTEEKREEYRQKYKNSIKEKYGVENVSQAKEIKEKKVQTFIKNYGKIHYFQTDEYKEKNKKLLLEKYGYEYLSQIPEIQEKVMRNSYKTKKHIDDDGNERLFQGYEKFAFDELKTQYKLNDILTNRKDVPRIDYKIKNKTFHYFCDIYIKSLNKLIEVKSTWTIKTKLEKNLEKAKEAINQNYDYEFWIYDSKKNKIIITKEYLITNNFIINELIN